MIGVFDSGFGGLSTLKELIKILPDLSFIYFGDSARTPYGNRSQKTITEFTEECINILFDRGAKIVLIACNTASADALRYLQSKFKDEKKILGVIIPAVEDALRETRYGKIGIVATRGTVKTKNYENEITKLSKNLYKTKDKKALESPKVYSQACPLLVPLIEEGWHEKKETRMIVRKYLKPLKNANIDTLILACTHYPLIEDIFKKKIGQNCKIINSAKSQAKSFEDYLNRHPEIEKKLEKKGERKFLTSDDPERFRELGSLFLGKKIERKSVEKIDI